VAQVGLQGTGIATVIGQLEAAGMPEHVRVRLDLQTSPLGGGRDDGGAAACRAAWPSARLCRTCQRPIWRRCALMSRCTTSLRPLLEHAGPLPDRQPDARPVLDRGSE
jgi:hypothetical protein